tara:strand:+ start:4228 stop:5010 length:783 start_codon:yes stop_codon:yes gene_type:complete
MANAVAEKKETGISTDVMEGIFEMEGAGADFNSDEMQMPFIRIAQAMSPEIKKSDAKYIKDCGQGDIFNNLTQEYWADGVSIVPCYVQTKYTEWVSLDDGGGFIGEIDPKDPVLTQTKREGSTETLPNGNEVVKADNYVVLVKCNDGTWSPAVLDMKSTALKVSRRWKTQISLQTITHPKSGKVLKSPIFANIWKLQTVEETNKQNQTYFNYTVSKVGLIDDANLFAQARALYVSSTKGEVKTDAPEQSPKEIAENEIPF